MEEASEYNRAKKIENCKIDLCKKLLEWRGLGRARKKSEDLPRMDGQKKTKSRTRRRRRTMMSLRLEVRRRRWADKYSYILILNQARDIKSEKGLFFCLLPFLNSPYTYVYRYRNIHIFKLK